MTVRELISKLENIEDKDCNILLEISWSKDGELLQESSFNDMKTMYIDDTDTDLNVVAICITEDKPKW